MLTLPTILTDAMWKYRLHDPSDEIKEKLLMVENSTN